MRLHKVLFELLLIFSVLLPQQSATAQDGTNTLQITMLGEPVVEFPQISLQVNVLRNGQAIAGLGSANFHVNGESFENLIATQIEKPVNLGVVIDLSAGTDLGLVREVLRTYFQSETYFRDGDKAFFVLSSDSTLQVVQYENRDEINNFINGLALSGSNFRYSPALEALVSQFSEGQPGAQVLLVGSYFNYTANDATPIAERAAQLFQQGFILNTIQAHASTQRTNATPQFQTIAEQGGGGFADYRGNQDTDAIMSLFDMIQSNRVNYQITYNTVNAEAGLHVLEIVVDVEGITAVSPFSYTYSPPDIVIVPDGSSVDVQVNSTAHYSECGAEQYLIDRYWLLNEPDLVQEIETSSDIAEVYIAGMKLRDTMLNYENVPECVQELNILTIQRTLAQMDILMLTYMANNIFQGAEFAFLAGQMQSDVDDLNDQINNLLIELGWINADGEYTNEPLANPTPEGE